MKKLPPQKLCAALVMIGWMATLVAFWGLDIATKQVIANDGQCCPEDLKHVGFRLEMTSEGEKALAILDGEESCQLVTAEGEQTEPAAEKRAACIRAGFAEEIRVDSVLIPSYSFFALALFLFVRSRRKATRWAPVLIVVGVLLAVTIFVSDFLGNHQLNQLIDLASKPRSPEILGEIQAHLGLLQSYTFFKLGAVALVTALLGVFWSSRSNPLRTWIVRLLSLAVAALFVIAMVQESWRLGIVGMGACAALAFGALIHTIAVVVEPE